MKFFLFIFFVLYVLISKTFAQVNLNDGLIAFYNFNGNSEDLCHNHSVVFANNSFANDLLNNATSCAYFDGSQYIEILDANDLTFDKNILTISCWVRCDDTSRTGAILSKRNSWGNFEYSIDNGMNKGYWVFDHWTNGGKNAVYGSDPFKSKISLEQGVWKHIVFVSDNFELRNYTNGLKSSGIDLKNSGMNFENTTSNFCIGKGGVFAKDYYFKGAIDNLRIYNRALSETEILELNRIESNEVETEIQVQNIEEKIMVNVLNVYSNKILYLYNIYGSSLMSFECNMNQLNSFYIAKNTFPAGVYILTDGKELVTKFAILY